MALNFEVGDASLAIWGLGKNLTGREILRNKVAPGENSETRSKGTEGDWGVGAPRSVLAQVSSDWRLLAR